MGDMATAPPDLNGLDLFGVDLASAPVDQATLPDFLGVDFVIPAGADIAGMQPTCMDTVKNGAETDVDCGGGMCPACEVGKTCQKPADCKTNLCLNLACANQQMAKITFGAGVAYPSGSLPVKIARGDFNNDGKLDLVTANQGAFGKTSDVSLFSGAGNGTFAVHVRSTAGFNPNWVAVADLNADKRDDVLVANGGNGMANSGGLGALTANMQGALGPSVDQALAGGPAAVVAGDFDRDGKLDAVVVANGQGKPGIGAVFIGKGDGTFGGPATFVVGASPSDVQAGDFNGDGILDLVVANGGDFSGPPLVALHLGGANAQFAAGKQVQTGPGTTAVLVGDLNADAKADIITLATINNNANLVVLLGKGDGTFQAPINKVIKGSDPSGLAAADFDSDGRLDVALLYRSGTLAVFGGNGDGNTQAEASFPATSNMGGYSMVAGDWNGDKKPDIAAVDYFKNQIVVLLNTTM